MPCMLTRWRRLLAILAVLGSTLAGPRPAWACSCAPPEQPPNAFAQADAVFAGTVTAINDVGLGSLLVNQIRDWLGLGLHSGLYGRQITLAVNDSWKGVTTTRVRLVTGYGSADCGYTFVVRNQYLVYGYYAQDGLGTNICTRTTDVSSAGADLNYLQTQPKLALMPLPLASSQWLIYLSVPLVIGLLLLAIVVWKRRN